MNNIRTELKWAFIFTGFGLLWMVMEKALGWHDALIDKHATYTMLFTIPAIILVVFALREKRNKDYGGTMTYMQGFKAGLIMTLIIVILSPLSQWITSTYVTPDYFNNAIEYAVESGKSTREQAESYFNFKSYVIQSAIGGLVMGTVTSALVAIFMRKS